MFYANLKNAKVIIAMAAVGMGAHLSAAKGTTDLPFHNDYYDYIHLIFDTQSPALPHLKIQDLMWNKAGSSKESNLLKGGTAELSPCHPVMFSFDFKSFKAMPIHASAQIRFTVKSVLDGSTSDFVYVAERFFDRKDKEVCFRAKIKPIAKGARLETKQAIPGMDGVYSTHNRPFSFKDFDPEDKVDEPRLSAAGMGAGGAAAALEDSPAGFAFNLGGGDDDEELRDAFPDKGAGAGAGAGGAAPAAAAPAGS